jgi:hypothetical protein
MIMNHFLPKYVLGVGRLPKVKREPIRLTLAAPNQNYLVEFIGMGI